MAVSLGAVMAYCRNYFERGFVEGDFTIADGRISPDVKTLYVYISGSAYHDGVYRLIDGMIAEPQACMPDESFHGRVWMLHPPSAFMELFCNIEQYDQKNPVGALQSESFGEYSYTRASTNQGGAHGWQGAFAGQLARYMRMFTEVM